MHEVLTISVVHFIVKCNLLMLFMVTGGAADKGGILRIGDELRSVNNVDLSNMARIEAWNFLKKLPDGTVTLVIRKKLTEESPKTE